MNPQNILFCGGGIRVLAHIGVLKVLHKKGWLKNVKEWIGVSSGALLAFCLAIGYTLEEIEDVSLRFDFTNVITIDSPVGWFLNAGIDSGENLEKLICALLRIKNINPQITFQELSSISKYSFRTFATNMKTSDMIIFSPQDSPTYKIVDAVKATMSFPYIFQPFEDGCGNMLIDGGVISNYPMDFLSIREKNRTLGFLLEGEKPKNNCSICSSSLKDLLLSPFNISLFHRTQEYAERFEKNTLPIKIPDFFISTFDFSIGKEEREEVIRSGERAGFNYLQSIKKAVVRRNSVS